jgi:hypothetical protein
MMKASKVLCRRWWGWVTLGMWGQRGSWSACMGSLGIHRGRRGTMWGIGYTEWGS